VLCADPFKYFNLSGMILRVGFGTGEILLSAKATPKLIIAYNRINIISNISKNKKYSSLLFNQLLGNAPYWDHSLFY